MFDENGIAGEEFVASEPVIAIIVQIPHIVDKK